MFYDPKWDKKVKELEKQDEWRAVLLKAAKILEEKGWVQQSFAKRGSYCIIGAINKAIGRHPSNDDLNRGKNQPLFNEVVSRLEERIPRQRSWGNFGYYQGAAKIESWNDDERRTKEQVLKTLRDCAIKG